MRILRPDISRTDIDADVGHASYPGHAPARWALPLIALLDAEADGWQLVELDERELSALWLPAHAGEACHGDSMRLGDGDAGAPLQEAHDWLATHAVSYAAANPSCWGRITHASRSAPSPIVVSPQGVGDRIKPDRAALVVVDGFHRALGYWMAGRRDCQAYVPRISPRQT